MDNLADLLTRGITFQQLSSSIQWRHGPTWLNSPSKWPVWPHPELLLIQADYDEEVETPPVGPPLDETTEPPNIEIQHLVDVTRFSKLSKLLSVTAYVCQFTHNTRQPSSSQLVGPLTSPELSQANLKWIHNTQQTVFAKEIANIQSCQNRLPLVRQLKLFLDSNNLLQCGGRIHNTPLSELTRFPYLLPPRHHFTTLVIQNAHVVQLHSGINATLTTLCQKYWIPSARQRIKSILRQCVVCKKIGGQPYTNPNPPSLVKSRVSLSDPFTITGWTLQVPCMFVPLKEKARFTYACLHVLCLEPFIWKWLLT